VGGWAASTTSTSSEPLAGSNFRPHCSRTAEKLDGLSKSAGAIDGPGGGGANGNSSPILYRSVSPVRSSKMRPKAWRWTDQISATANIVTPSRHYPGGRKIARAAGSLGIVLRWRRPALAGAGPILDPWSKFAIVPDCNQSIDVDRVRFCVDLQTKALF